MGKKTLCNSQEEYDEKIIHKQKLKDYINNMKKFIVTSRFNNNTWKENQLFRDKMPFGCIYCSPDMITSKIPTDSVVFVLEMNNETNKIMGIGMVRNHPVCGKYRVYLNGNYNRFVYSGKYRIDRNEMTEEEDKIMQAFDILCFKGNTHMKRGQGLKSFPLDMLFRCKKVIDLVDFVSRMFKERISKENINKITKEVEN
jgi:hypothetical protein